MFKIYTKTSLIIISLFGFFALHSCACTQKYNDQQNRYMEIHAQKQTEEDNHRRDLKQKDEQIAELIRHNENLESQI